MTEEIIPSRIRMAREKAGITMVEAARRLGVTKIGYCRYEYGERKPSLPTLRILAQCLGTSVTYLIGETEDMEPDTLIIERQKTPEVYELAERCLSLDAQFVKRILTYSKKIQESQNLGAEMSHGDRFLDSF